MQHTEALLMALVVGVYLYDSALRMYSNEAVMIPVGQDRWLAGFGSNKTTFKGKEFYLPNLLVPTRPLFKLAWDFEIAIPSQDFRWSIARKEFGHFVPLVWGLAASTFLLLPVALFGRLGDLIILLAFSLIYLHVLLIILLLWIERAKFDVTARGFAVIAVDLLICPPFALNIVKRLSLIVSVQEDFINAARRLQSPVDWETTKTQVLARLDDEIGWEEDGCPRMKVLLERRSGLTNEDSPCPALIRS